MGGVGGLFVFEVADDDERDLDEETPVDEVDEEVPELIVEKGLDLGVRRKFFGLGRLRHVEDSRE